MKLSGQVQALSKSDRKGFFLVDMEKRVFGLKLGLSS
jgi:hypothetical protein